MIEGIGRWGNVPMHPDTATGAALLEAAGRLQRERQELVSAGESLRTRRDVLKRRLDEMREAVTASAVKRLTTDKGKAPTKVAVKTAVERDEGVKDARRVAESNAIDITANGEHLGLVRSGLRIVGSALEQRAEESRNSREQRAIERAQGEW